jgi:outer membrane lipoprotein LolB
MLRRIDGTRGCLIGLLCAGFLAGCVTAPRATPPMDVAQQTQFLSQLQRYSFSGSVGVAPQGLTPSVEWRQQQALTKVKLAGPLGAGSMQLEFSPSALRLATGRGEQLVDADAEQVLLQELGFLPPFEALRYWVLGVPAPGAVTTETRNAAGTLQRLEQQGWTIVYERRESVASSAGGVQLPTKLRATRGEQRLTLVVYRWRLK